MSEGIDWVWSDDGDRVPPDDRGLAYGQGVFETIGIGARGPLLEDYHRRRLLRGCHALGIRFDESTYARWRQDAQARGLLEAASPGRLLKLTVTAGSGGRGYRQPDAPRPRVITATGALPQLPGREEPVRVRSCRQRVRIIPERQGLKTLERLDQVMASSELGSNDFEGVMNDSRDYPLEGTRSNVFVLVGDRLVTPEAGRLAVVGTLRSWLASVLPELGCQLVEQDLTATMIRENGLLLGNSVMGLVNATAWDEDPLPVPASARVLRDEIAKLLGLD